MKLEARLAPLEEQVHPGLRAAVRREDRRRGLAHRRARPSATFTHSPATARSTTGSTGAPVLQTPVAVQAPSLSAYSVYVVESPGATRLDAFLPTNEPSSAETGQDWRGCYPHDDYIDSEGEGPVFT